MSRFLAKLFRAGKASSDQRKVLFISHDDFRAGAQLFLLRFLTWLVRRGEIDFEIVIKNVCGDLVHEFSALAPVTIWNDPSGQDPSPSRMDEIKERLRSEGVGLIYSNTFTNGTVLDALAELNRPIITHVHELGYWITNRTDAGNNESVLRHSDHFVAASRAVQQNLIANLGIPADRTTLVHEFVPTDLANDLPPADEIRGRLGIPADALVVGACGTLDWRKGADLFVPLAQAVREVSGRSIHFVWVGGDTSAQSFAPLQHDLQHAQLEGQVHFVGVQPRPHDYFQVFDVFTLTSREDPFPLVALEAASLAKPIVCFDGSGGIKEFVEADCGFVVPYLDIVAMASSLRALLSSPTLRERLGRTALEKVRRRHDMDVGGPELIRLIERFRGQA